MSFNVSPRESISRCTTYDNKFRTYVDEPLLKDARRVQFAKDSVESESARLERQMMDKYLKGSVQQEGSSLRFVKQVAKFIFVAVFYPPFMIAYTVPKWVITYGLPFVADLTGQYMNRLIAGLSPMGAWALQVSGMMTENFNKFFRAQFEKFYRAFKSSQDFLKQTFLKASEYVKAGLRFMSAPFIRAIDYLKQKVESRWARIKKWLTAKGNMIKARVAPWLPRAPKVPKIKLTFSKIKQGIDFVRSLPFKLHLAVQRGLKVVKEKAPLMAEKGFNGIKAFGQNVARLKAIPLAVGDFIWEILRANYQGWIEPYIQWIMPFSRYIKHRVRAGGLFVTEKAHLGLETAAKGLELSKAFLFNALDKALSPIKKGFGIAVKFVQVHMQKLGNRIKTAAEYIQNQITLTGQKGLNAARAVTKFVQSKALSLFRFVLRLPHLVVKGLQATVSMIMTGVQESVKGIKTWGIFLKVLCRLGAHYVRTNWV